YYLNGGADIFYTSDRVTAGNTTINSDSLRQRYSLGLNGPILGPLIGVFSVSGGLTKNALSANDSNASDNGYTLNGTAALFPTGKLRLALYYNLAKENSDTTVSRSSFDSDNYGLTFSPRVFRGTTFLSYDHSSSSGNVTDNSLSGAPYSDRQDRGTFLYRDDWRFEQGGRLSYEYNLTLLREDRNNRGVNERRNEADNRLLVTYDTKFGDATRWQNYLEGDVQTQSTTGEGALASGTSFSIQYTSNLLHNFARDISGYLDLSHSTLKTPFTPLADTDIITVTGDYANIPNPVKKLNLNIQTSLGTGRQWETGSQLFNSSLTATSKWSLLRYFDILNDLAYSYQGLTTSRTGQDVSTAVLPGGGGVGNNDAFAYEFGVQGKGMPVKWYADYTYQKLGLFTSPSGAGTSHTVAAGEVAGGEKLYNQSDYSFTRTDIPGDNLLTQSHLLRSTTIYRHSRTLSLQLLPYVMKTTTSSNGTRSDVTIENISLDVNWNPLSRLALTGGGDISHSSGTGGNGFSYGLRGTLRYVFPLFNINLSYLYKQQNQSALPGNFNGSESRIELTFSTSFGFRLGGFGPKTN
ncbi:MAG TPA: hypothetical protein VF799_05725, partial [Geobacteraceae bacterium]